MIVRKAFELRNPGGKQRSRPARVSPAVVMKGRGDLDQALKESFLRLPGAKPYFFPNLMRLEEAARIELCDTALEWITFFHRALI